LFSMALTGFSGNYLENPLKTVVATSAVSLILLVRPLPRYFWIGIFVGTIGAATLALIQRFFMLMPRAEGFSMPITFGDIAMAMGLMSLASVQPFAKTRWAALPYISFIAGLVASILSGSRGGWLALLLSFIPLYSYGRFALGRRIIVIFCVAVLLISGAIYLPQTGVQGRLLDVSREITLYRNGNPNTSVGARLEMWKGAWLLFREHPLMGVGRIHYNAGMRDLIGRGVIDPTMRDYRHAHNEWLHALATEGIFGAIALLALYGAPILFFTRQLRQDGLHRPYALAGLLLILSYIDFGLTQVMFAHHVSSAFYAVTVCALIGVCLQYQSAAAGVKA
jgi:O-antigen ligase